MHRPLAGAVIGLVVVAVAIPAAAVTWAGALDPTFGAGGVVTTDITALDDRGDAVAIQSDGKIVVAGGAGNPHTALVRYTAAGALDPTFDGDGRVLIDFGSMADRARAIAIQPDGKIVVAGWAYDLTDTTMDIAVARFDSSGSLDTSFSGDGKVTTSFGASDERGSAVAIEPDGDIVVGGYAFGASGDDFALVRYTSTGALDATFDGDGKVTTSFGSSSDRIDAIALQPDGSIVAAGYWTTGITEFAVARYTAGGALDTTFSGDGRLTTNMGASSSAATSVAIQPDGKIVTGGWGYPTSNYDIALTRYDTAGALDPSFSGDGKVVTNLGSDEIVNAIALLPGGKIAVAGQKLGTNWDFLVGLYDDSGTLDSSFGDAGTVVHAIGTGDDYANAIAVQPTDGMIVAAGASVQPSTNTDIAVTRYAFETVLDTPVITSGPSSSGPEAAFTLASTDTGVAFRCSLDGAAWEFCTSSLKLTGLADGSHELRVKTLGGASGATSDAASRTWVVDTAAPNTAIEAGPSGAVGDSDAAFSFSSSEPARRGIAFGTEGRVTTAFGGSDRAQAVVVQPDGGIVVAGTAWNGADQDLAVARYLPDGSPDPAFDGDGTRLLDLGGAGEEFGALALQPDGKIVAAGTSNSQVVVARFEPDGASDTSFDGDGAATVLVQQASTARSVVVQPDGKIVVGGWSYSMPTGQNLMVVRFGDDGSLDPTFGTGGTVWTNVNGHDYGFGIGLETDGDIVMAGSSGGGGGGGDFTLARYTPSGALDPSFGFSGVAVNSLGMSIDAAQAVTIQPDGRIVAVGYVHDLVQDDVAMARYTTTGSLDATFGTGGSVVTALTGGNDRAWGVTLQPDGKIVVGGTATPAATSDIAALRYSSNGSLDPTFGTGGATTVSFGAGADGGAAVALQNDGHVLVAGTADAGGEPAWALARLRSNGDVDDAAAFDCRLDAGPWGACDSGTKTHAALPDGGHTFEVRALDAAGNPDPSPASRTWTVDTQAPQTSIDSGPSGPTGSADASFAFSSNEGGATFRCSWDEAAYADCTSPASAVGLAEGEHTFRVRARDAAGNTDETPAVASWTVDTSAGVDTWVKLSPDLTYVGDGVVNATGAGQTRVAKIARGATAVFDVRVTNTSLLADTMIVTGVGGSSGFKVTYFAGATNVTAQVTGTGYPVPLGASGVADLQLKIKATKSAAGSTSRLVTVSSQAAPSVLDAVLAKVKVR